MQLAQHGLAFLSLAIFLQAIGLPIPGAVALILAAAQAATGHVSGIAVVGSALLAMLAGDAVMFLLGRRTGWWLLGTLCRISLNPESCVVTSADTFHRRGRPLLVVAKFLPGINTMAPPLAGSMQMGWWSFLGLDTAGCALYIGAYFVLGYLCSGAVTQVIRFYERFGHLTTAVVLILLTAYGLWLLWGSLRARRLGRAVPHAPAAIVARELKSGEALVFDVRSHGYFDSGAVRIPGSRRVDPNALRASLSEFAQDRQIYLYCTCARQATSVRVARELLKLGLRVAVIDGGLRGWRSAGLAVETVPPEELAALPLFS
ncbi:MAG TPA: rhodanese-like domain-containing protein [Steroidobacteraceae bacterium]|jgi:membrane protein DedA with SNARE-associated domain/rhodanese-related sulfurtransferase|nr:rhodanese-like domain-containing protein [Steroidobacteraceae bacterium]